MTEAKGKLMDAATIMREYGVSRSVADSWVRNLPKIVHPGGVKKIYIRRVDLERMLDTATMVA